MEVSPHTALKHRTLGVYFLICRQVMKKRKLHYVDLFAGDGECICEEAPLKKWKCPFIKSLLAHAKKEKLSLNCFLNELNLKNFERLKENVKPYNQFIMSLTQEDANVIYEKILKKVPKEEWSIFFLDPYKHSQLDWETVEQISNHEGWDIVNKCTRRPELIINLMTLSMQRSVKTNPDSITRALGTDEWKERIKNQTEEKMHKIFLDIFIKNLENAGYSVTYFLIKQTPPYTNVMYYLIFASSIPQANEIIAKKFKPYIDNITKEKWVRENFTYRMITKARKKGDSSLSDFIKQNN